jgi:hypothetical protein
MRHRIGKGQIIAFDATLEKRLEEMRKAKGYYPTLKEIGESFTPPHSVNFIFRALRRLYEAGKLSDEANKVYDAKNKTGDKNENSQKIIKTKTSAKAKRIKK